MKPQNIHLSIATRETPTFARPLSPGCPTDSVGTFTDVTPLWTPQSYQSRTTISREPSWNAASATGPPASSVWRIEPGTFVAFSLDTDVVAEQFPVGSDARIAILSFPVGRYIGLVASSFAYYPEDGPQCQKLVEELVINYVGDTVPQLDGVQTHAMPIHPSTRLDWAIPPLKTTTLFPWKDRYQWTTLGTRLQITQLHESRLKFDLHEDDFAAFEDQVAVNYPDMTNKLAKQQDDGATNNEVLGMLQVPMYRLPAKIWRDVREANCRDNPTAFADEVSQLSSLCKGHDP